MTLARTPASTRILEPKARLFEGQSEEWFGAQIFNMSDHLSLNPTPSLTICETAEKSQFHHLHRMYNKDNTHS